jgi:transposase
MEKTGTIIASIKRATKRLYAAEEKIKIVMEGLRGEIPVSDLCRRENISTAVYYRWSKDFLEAGKNGLTRDTQRNANDDQVKQLRKENEDLKYALANSVLETQRLKKSLGLL